MPGPSWSPIFAAIGTALLMWGLVYGGAMLWLGILALALTLLYWLAEGMRTYDHDLGSTVPALPAESTRARRPASTCPAHPSARSSARSGCRCSWPAWSSADGSWWPASWRSS